MEQHGCHDQNNQDRGSDLSGEVRSYKFVGLVPVTGMVAGVGEDRIAAVAGADEALFGEHGSTSALVAAPNNVR